MTKVFNEFPNLCRRNENIYTCLSDNHFFKAFYLYDEIKAFKNYKTCRDLWSLKKKQL